MTLLADRAGHPFALARMNPQEMLKATILSFDGDETALRQLIQAISMK